MSGRKRDYPTGNPDGMSFICNRWVFTGPEGYQVVPNGDGETTFHVIRYEGSTTRPVWWDHDSHHMTEDEAHELARRLATPSYPRRTESK